MRWGRDSEPLVMESEASSDLEADGFSDQENGSAARGSKLAELEALLGVGRDAGGEDVDTFSGELTEDGCFCAQMSWWLDCDALTKYHSVGCWHALRE